MTVRNKNQTESAQKNMQVGVDETCMYTKFGGCGLSDFRAIATFKKI